MTPDYRVELRILDPIYEQQPSGEWGFTFHQTLIGDIRPLAQNLKWTKARTSKGVDFISFTVNDVLFAEWLERRSTSISDVLRPQYLDCRIVRNGIAIVGGTLATLPSYSPLNASANLSLEFDGYFNLLNGVYLYPTATQTARFDQILQGWVEIANQRCETKTGVIGGFNLKPGTISQLATVDRGVPDYKTIKDTIADASDNSEGAGAFEFYIHPDRTFDILKDSEFGTTQVYTIYYPQKPSGISATSVSADAVDGYRTRMICIGAGEVSSNPSENTAIIAEADAQDNPSPYAYVEGLLQLSSISTQSVLNAHATAEIKARSSIMWEPEIELSGRHVNPAPQGEPFIWIGDTVQFSNTLDQTGRMDGAFRVQQLAVSVSATGAETIVPTLERIIE
jgi:hypothetical protein